MSGARWLGLTLFEEGVAQEVVVWKVAVRDLIVVDDRRPANFINCGLHFRCDELKPVTWGNPGQHSI